MEYRMSVRKSHLTPQVQDYASALLHLESRKRSHAILLIIGFFLMIYQTFFDFPKFHGEPEFVQRPEVVA